MLQIAFELLLHLLADVIFANVPRVLSFGLIRPHGISGSVSASSRYFTRSPTGDIIINRDLSVALGVLLTFVVAGVSIVIISIVRDAS